MKENLYEKFISLPHSMLLTAVEGLYKKKFKEDYYVVDVIKGEDEWIVKWKKRINPLKS